MTRQPRRAGVTCLEIQVALVVLGVALAGICPLAVIQMKLLKRIESTPIGPDNFQVIRGQRIIDGEPYLSDGAVGTPPITVLQPAASLWMRRLGTAAPFQNSVKPQAPIPLLTEATIEDDGATYAGSWTAQPAADASGGACHVSQSGNPSGSATWTFGPIVPGRYRVMISWPSSIPIPSDATFTILDASSNVVVVSSGQMTQVDGGPWRDLGNYSLGTSLVLRVRGSSIGQVVADAARIGARNTVTFSALAATDAPPSSAGVARRAKVDARP